MKTLRTLIAASLLLSSAAFAADGAATLSAQQGTVLVNQGEEFVTASASQALNAGDRVMVMEGGSAEITFADGCVLPLESGSMVSVSAQSTCAGDVAQVEQIGPTYAQAVGAPREARCDDNDDSNDEGCAMPVRVIGANENSALVFGLWGAGIAWALIDNNASP
jgi:uncharacterized protein (DUF2345 family)